MSDYNEHLISMAGGDGDVVADMARETANRVGKRYARLHQMLRDELQAQAWDEGAKAGWKQSGEGWNAEYPDESTGRCSVDLTGNPHRSKS